MTIQELIDELHKQAKDYGYDCVLEMAIVDDIENITHFEYVTGTYHRFGYNSSIRYNNNVRPIDKIVIC